jgi:hypothetical protein
MQLQTEITEMNRKIAVDELGRLRNRHVAKILDFLDSPPPYIEAAIKRSYSMFAEDVERNIINSDNSEGTHGKQRMG